MKPVPGGNFFFSLRASWVCTVFSLALLGIVNANIYELKWPKEQIFSQIFVLWEPLDKFYFDSFVFVLLQLKHSIPRQKARKQTSCHNICLIFKMTHLSCVFAFCEYIPFSCFLHMCCYLNMCISLPAGAQRSAPTTRSLCVQLPKIAAPPDWRFEIVHGAMSDWTPPLSASGCSHRRRKTLRQRKRRQMRSP